MASSLNAQSFKEDLNFLIQVNTDTSVKVQTRQLSPFQKYNPLFWFFDGSLTIYQKVLSPQISASCLYQQSCSRFSRAAISEFGIVKGIALTADRLSRCNRVAGSSINPFRITESGKVYDLPAMYRLKNTSRYF
jgi:putative component of membrane protein insertase Oxa1/YidC/SpoIIIJ protein YidD